MLVGVFMTSFRFCLWGVKEEEGRAMGTYTCLLMMWKVSFPCKPVSLSHHVCISADHPLWTIKPKRFHINWTPKALSVIMKMPPKLAATFTKAAKESDKIHLGEICSKQTSFIFFRAYAFSDEYNRLFKRLLAICTLSTTIHPTCREWERDWMQYTRKLKRDIFSLFRVHHIFLSFSFPRGICSFAPTPLVKIKKTISKGSLFFLQAEQSSL